MFEHFGVTPELAFRGRETDFPPGNAAYGVQTRVWALDQVYAWAEGTKLVLGAAAGRLLIYLPRAAHAQADGRDRSLPSNTAGSTRGV